MEIGIGDFLSATLRGATPLLFCALGVLLAGRAGVLHLGVEGTMLIGALASVLGTVFGGNPWMGVLASIMAGVAFGLILAVLTVYLPTDQVAIGIMFNLVSIGITSFILRLVIEEIDVILPVIPPIFFGISSFTLVALISAGVMWWLLFRTGPGLKVRATGEDAHAAHAAGTNIARVRLAILTIASVLSSLGGAYLSIGWVRGFTDNVTLGRGYIALAAAYCSRWNPLIVLVVCLVFGAGEALAFRAQAGAIGVNPYYVFMVPYVLTILVVALAGRGRDPAEVGKPYIRR